MPGQNVLSDQEFHHELVKRFFHPKSYFYKCLKREIQALNGSHDSANREEYELFDRMLEKIVASEDKRSLLAALEPIPGFGQFSERLNDGISYLRENELNCDKMKIEIESLAQSLIKVSIKALFDARTKAQLGALLSDQEIVDLDLEGHQQEYDDQLLDHQENQPEYQDAQQELQKDDLEHFDAPELAEPIQIEFENNTELESVVDPDLTIENEFDFMGKVGDIQDQSSTLEDQFDEIPIEMIEDLQSESFDESLEPSVALEAPLEESMQPPHTEPEKIEPEIVPEGAYKSPDISDEERDFLLVVNGGTEASDKGGCEIDPGNAGGSIDSSPVDQPEISYINAEPFSLVDGFALEIKHELTRLQQAIDALNGNSGSEKFWRECESVFDKIAAKSMIFGFEGFEQIAVKSKRFVGSVMKRLETVNSYHIELLTTARQTFLNLLQGDIDHVDRMAIQELSDSLDNPKPIRKKRAARKSNARPEATPEKTPSEKTKIVEPQPVLEAPPVEPKPEPEVLLEPVEQPVTEVKTTALDNEPNDFDIAKFSLPGEDDEEIMNLVSEISESGGALETPPDPEMPSFDDPFDTESGDKITFDQALPESDLVSLESDFTSLKLDSEVDETLPQAEPLATTPKPTGAVAPDEKLSVFKEQSEFYFNIIEDSLEKLKSQPEDRIALEDLELSSHSLYELSHKLNLDEISAFPGAVEELVRNIISRGVAISKDQYQLIREVYDYFLKLNRAEEADSANAKKLIAAIKGLTGHASKTRSAGQNRMSSETDLESLQIV